MTLLTYSQQQLIKPISDNNESKYSQIEKEVEEVELRDLLGVELLQDIQANPTNASNIKLLDPHTFVNCRGNSVQHKGLRYVIAYFNYARYVGSSHINDTFTGFVTKNREEATSITSGDINRLQIENRKSSLREWELIKEYLDLNAEDYPLWDCVQRKHTFKPKFTFLRNTVK